MALNLAGRTTASVQQEDKSVLETIGDVSTMGVSSAALSAGIGFANTGLAIANVLGGDFEAIDTGETLDSWGFENTADYYNQHKTAIDAVGFVAGSFIPGGLAVKAVRSAQKANALGFAEH
jgi:hypothetical protein